MKETLGNHVSPPRNVRLRCAEIADEPFLVRVYASARAEELVLVPWDDQQKQAFVEMQFAAQVQHYRTHYPAAQQLVICADDKPVGRLYLHKTTTEFRILDIAILLENRSAGIGTHVIRNILDEALAARLPVTIYVESFNPSLQLFRNTSNDTATDPTTIEPAFAIDIAVWKDQGTAATSVTSPTFSTHAANETLLVFVSTDAIDSISNQVNSVSGGGLTWTLVKRMNTQKGDAEIWRASASTLLSNVSVSATLSRAVLSSLTVVSFIGSNGIGASNGCNAASGAPTCSLTTTATNSWVFGVGNDWNNAIPRTLGPNQAMVHYYLTPLNDTYWVQRQTAVTPSSGTVVKINDTAPTGDSYNLVVVEVLAQ